jgi:hypothetical protein
VHPLPGHSRLLSLRWLAVALLCLSTPAVQDIIVDTSSWLAGAECCADECEETGNPCTQQCLHCVCGVRAIAAPLPSGPQARTASLTLSLLSPEVLDVERAGHLDPPFRPPVS